MIGLGIAALLWAQAPISQPPVSVEVNAALGFEDPCALSTRVPEAIRRTFPSIILQPPKKAALQIELRLERGRLALLVKPKAPNPQLRRTIESPYLACEATADAVALILERYLTDLGYRAESAPLPQLSTPQTETATAPKTPTEPSPEVKTPTEARTATASSPRQPLSFAWPLRLALGVNGQARAPTEAIAQPGLGLSIALGVGGLELSLRGAFHFFENASIFRDANPGPNEAPLGQIRVYGVQMSLGAGWCFDDRPLRWCIEAFGGVERSEAQVSGDGIFQTRTGQIWAPVVGAAARVDWTLLKWFTIGARLGALGRPQTVEFQVEDAFNTYKLPPVSAILSLGLWFDLYSTRFF